MKPLHKFHFYLTGLIMGLCVSSCEDFVEIDPPNSRVVGSTVFENDRLATSAVEGIYHQMFNSGNFAGGSQWSVTTAAGLSADEFEVNPFSTSLLGFYRNDIDPSNPANLSLWSSAYNTIYMANAAMEGLESSSGITPETKRQLEGEVRFVRAFTYFYLVNFYGDVPLITSADYRTNAIASQVPPDDIYQAIINDLEQSGQLLDDTYRNSERTHPNRLAASALLSRVYFYQQQWDKAVTLTSEVIGSTCIYNLLEDINDVFQANSLEALWQIAPTNVGNTNEGNMFILTSSPVSSPWNPVYLKEELVSSFENQDKRALHWIGTFESDGTTFYYPYKYKIRLSSEQPTEYATVLRLAELYLIRAESYVRMGDFQGALADLNVIRNRAGLENFSGDSEQALLAAILQERQKEFFSEWGHRWLDLKRLSLANEVLSPGKEGWQETDVLYPIPQQELDKAPTLNQNSGY